MANFKLPMCCHRMQNWEAMCEICPWQSSTSVEVLIPVPPPWYAVDLRAPLHTKSGVNGAMEAGAINLIAINTCTVLKGTGLNKDSGGWEAQNVIQRQRKEGRILRRL